MMDYILPASSWSIHCRNFQSIVSDQDLVSRAVILLPPLLMAQVIGYKPKVVQAAG